MIFPDAPEHTINGRPPPSEDQSDILPQGTILRMEDSQGKSIKINTDDSRERDVQKLLSHLDAIRDQPVRDAVLGFADGGTLNNGSDTTDKVSSIDILGGRNPEATAEKAFEDIITAAGYDPVQVLSSLGKTGIRSRLVTMENGTIILFSERIRLSWTD